MILAYIVYFSLLLLMVTSTIPVVATRTLDKNGFIANKISSLFPIIIISIILGCRYGVGDDYFSYRDLYNSQCYHSIFESSASEWIFGHIYYWCYKAQLPYTFVQTILNVIFLSFLYASFKSNLKIFRWVIIFFFLTGVLFLYLNIQRQSIALAILFYSIQYIERRNFLKFIFYIFIAAGFHFSAFFFLPIYFLWHLIDLLKHRYVQLLLWGASLLFSDLLVDIISQLSILLLSGTPYERYGATVFFLETNKGSGIGPIVKAIIDLTIILYSKKLFYAYKKNTVFYIVYFLFLAGTILSNIFQYNLLLSRVAFLFVSFRIVVLAYIYDYIVDKGMQRDKIIALLLLLLCLLYFVGMIYIGNNNCSPFRFSL